MKTNLFSKSAMENLSTPEQLDQQVRIMKPASWILFAAILIGAAAAVVWAFIGTISSGSDYAGLIFNNENVAILNAETGGMLQDVLVEQGDTVSEGDILAVISSDVRRQKMEELKEERDAYEKGSREYRKIEEKISQCVGKTLIRSSVDGTVQKAALPGISVEAGDTVATVLPENLYSYQEVLVYVPKEEAGAFEVGMKAQITPAYVTREEYGYMEGVVAEISESIVTENSIIKHMGTMDYAEDILPDTSCVEIKVQLNINAKAENSYVWSNPKGERLSIESGDKCRVYIMKSEYHPYELLLN